MQSLKSSLNEKLRFALEQRVTCVNVSSGIMPPMPVSSSASRVASDNTPGTPTDVIQPPTHSAPSGLQLMRAAAVPDDVMSRLYYDSHVIPYPRDVAPLHVMRQHDVRESTGHNLRHTDMECVQDTEKAEIEEFLRVHCLRMTQGCRDVPVKELRHIIPILILQCFSMKGEQAQKKVKGLWERAPQGWPADVPYCDPNNAPLRSRTGEPIGTKPKKETLNHMFDFLIREYLRQNRNFLSSPMESRDSMTQQYSPARLLPPNGLWHRHHQQQQQPAALPISSRLPHPHSYASVYSYPPAAYAAPTNTTAVSGPASLLQYSAPHLSRGLPHPTLVPARTRHGERSNAYEEDRPGNVPWESRVVGQAEVSSISQALKMALKRSHSYDEMSSPCSEDSISSQTSVTDHMPPLLDCRSLPLALTSTNSSVPVFNQPISPCSSDGQGVLVTQQQQQPATSSSSQRPMTKKARLLAAVLPPLLPVNSETSNSGAAASPPLPPSPSSSPITPTTPHSVNEQAMNELMGRIADKMQALQQGQVAVDLFAIILVAQELLWKMRSLLDDVWILPYLEKLHELDCTLDAIGMLGCLPDSHFTRWQDFEEKWYVRINGHKRITSASSTAFTDAATVSINTVHVTAPSTATYC